MSRRRRCLLTESNRRTCAKVRKRAVSIGPSVFMSASMPRRSIPSSSRYVCFFTAIPLCHRTLLVCRTRYRSECAGIGEAADHHTRRKQPRPLPKRQRGQRLLGRPLIAPAAPLVCEHAANRTSGERQSPATSIGGAPAQLDLYVATRTSRRHTPEERCPSVKRACYRAKARYTSDHANRQEFSPVFFL